MNLASNPTQNELIAMLAKADDNAAHHIIWVGHDGEVHLNPLPEDLTPAGFQEANDAAIKFRLETCQCGNGYVGASAAADTNWTNRLYKALVRFWKEDTTGYQDSF